MARWLIATLADLVLAGNACADAGLPFFQRERLHIEIRFLNTHEYPEFDFYLHEMWGRTWRLLRTQSSEPVLLFGPSGTPGELFLLALPRGTAMPSEQKFDKEPPSGLLRSRRLEGPQGVVGEADNRTAITYRIRLDGDTFQADFVSATKPPISAVKIWATSIASALAALAVVIFVRRRRAKTIESSTE